MQGTLRSSVPLWSTSNTSKAARICCREGGFCQLGSLLFHMLSAAQHELSQLAMLGTKGSTTIWRQCCMGKEDAASHSHR